jgi:hypothetical protein
MLGHGPISNAPVGASAQAGSTGIALIGTSQSTYASTNSWSMSLPTGANVVGAITIINAAQRGAGTITFPSGWTSLFTAPGFAVAYRVYQSGDPTSITISSTVTGYELCAAVAYSGVDPTNPIDAFNSATLGPFGLAASIMRTPSVRPQYANSQLVVMGADNGSTSMGTYTSPTGITRQTSSNAAPNLYIGDALLTSAAITGTKDISWSTSTGGSNVTTAVIMGYQLALKAIGATAATQATPTVEYAGSTFPIYYQATSITATCSELNPQVGDYVLIGLCGTAFPSSVPAGWTTVVSTSYGAVYGKQWASGDVDPTFTWASSSFFQLYVGVFRALGGIGVQVDASGANTASSPSSIACPSLTPTSAYNELYHAYLATPGTISISTYPSGAVYNGSRSTANGAWAAAYLQPSPNPSGTQTFTGTMSGGVMAAGVLLKPVTSANVSVNLTGLSSTAKVGAPTPVFSKTLVGNEATGAYGALAVASAIVPTGLRATALTGAFQKAFGLTLTGLLGHATAGALAVGSSITPTGQKATGHTGAFAVAATIGTTGLVATGHTGSLIFAGLVLVGQVATSAVGQVAPEILITLGGLRASAARGVFGVASAHTMTGLEATGHVGALTPAQQFGLTGGRVTGAHGAFTVASGVTLTGRVAHALQGHFDLAATFSMSGLLADAFVGMLIPNQGVVAALKGMKAKASTGNFSVGLTLAPVGQRMTAAVGKLVTALEVSMRGQVAQATYGALGVEATISLGGQRVTAQYGVFALGNVWATANALLRTAPPQLVVQQAQNNPLAITANATMLAILSPNNIFIQT